MYDRGKRGHILRCDATRREATHSVVAFSKIRDDVRKTRYFTVHIVRWHCRLFDSFCTFGHKCEDNTFHVVVIVIVVITKDFSFSFNSYSALSWPEKQDT